MLLIDTLWKTYFVEHPSVKSIGYEYSFFDPEDVLHKLRYLYWLSLHNMILGDRQPETQEGKIKNV